VETPQERYAEARERAGLGDAELARSWGRAAREALRAPVEAVLPKEEVGRFGPEEPMALGYRMELRRGQRVRIRLDVDSPGSEDELRVFLEVFRVRGSDEEPQLLKVAWAEPEERTLEYEARATATHVLRVQPELLAGGSYRLLVGIEPSLAFPVEGVDAAAIRSFFGASRDGGRREHHGVDIFAPRGTPVLAASEGVVRRVGTNRLGGNVVWIRDEERGISQYYAHLDTQLVVGGIRVSPGDTLGLVGNTGNARTTPPHLHFGLYVRGEGPVDPFPFLHDPGGGLSPLEVDPAAFREVRRIVESGDKDLALQLEARGYADYEKDVA
jgi:murein DD-endopeptidase MepM/ murein hydrolase activator NlpD